MAYRAYAVRAIVMIHDCQDQDRDAGIVETITDEIMALASGDEIVIVAHPMTTA